jgi:hypothetical protein
MAATCTTSVHRKAITAIDNTRVYHCLRKNNFMLQERSIRLRGGDSEENSDESNSKRWPQLLSEKGVLLVIRGTPDHTESNDDAELVSLFASSGVPFDHYDIAHDKPMELPIWPPLPQACSPEYIYSRRVKDLLKCCSFLSQFPKHTQKPKRIQRE